MLGKAVQTARLGVLIAELFAAVAVVFGIAYMTMGSGRMMDNLTLKMSEDMRLNDGAIATGGNFEQLKADHKALLAKAALPGEAARNNQSLQVGFVSLRDLHATEVNGFTPVTLSVGKLSRAGVLIIADGPAHWTIANSRINQRAKLSFEGSSPVKTTQMPHGFLAGTRIKPFDTKDVVDVGSLENDVSQFCRTMRMWSGFYGLTFEKIHVSKIFVRRGTSQINAGDRGFKTPGGQVVSSGTADSLCK